MRKMKFLTVVLGLCAFTGAGFAQYDSIGSEPGAAEETPLPDSVQTASVAEQTAAEQATPAAAATEEPAAKKDVFLKEDASGQAQQLSLRQAVSFALEHNKSLQASRLNLDLYKKKLMETIAGGIPQISGAINYQTNFKEKVSLGGMADIEMKDNMTASVSAQWMAVNGAWIVGIQTAKIAQTLAAQQTALDELDVKANIYNSYYVILASEHIIEILQKNLEDMDKIMTHTQNLYDAGILEESDVDQIRITVGQLNNTLLSMQRTVDVNYNLLRIQMGLKAGTPLTLTDAMETFLGEEGFERLAVQTLDLDGNLSYQAVQTQELLQQKALLAAKMSCLPTLAASYNFQHQFEFMAGGFMTIPHTAVVQLNVPLFTGLQKTAQVAQQKISLQQVQLNKSLVEDQLMLQEAQLKYNLQSSLENYKLQTENVAVAKSVLNHYQAKYEVGRISSLDLTQANSNYLTAENNYVSACLELLQAQTALLKLYNELN